MGVGWWGVTCIARFVVGQLGLQSLNPFAQVPVQWSDCAWRKSERVTRGVGEVSKSGQLLIILI